MLRRSKGKAARNDPRLASAWFALRQAPEPHNEAARESTRSTTAPTSHGLGSAKALMLSLSKHARPYGEGDRGRAEPKKKPERPPRGSLFDKLRSLTMRRHGSPRVLRQRQHPKGWAVPRPSC